jgi:streptogramin lyase
MRRLAALLMVLCNASIYGQPVVAPIYWMTGNASSARNIVSVNPNSGAQTTITQNGNFVSPLSMVLSPDGSILVADADTAPNARGAIIRVNLTNGSQTIVSQGGSFINPSRITNVVNGNVYVSDAGASGVAPSRVFRVNISTGSQTLITESDLLGFGTNQDGLAIEPSGMLLATTFNNPRILRINPSNGDQQILSQNGLLHDPRGIAVDAAGNIYVADTAAGIGAQGAIIKIDPITATQTIVSQAGMFQNPSELALDGLGNVIVSDTSASTNGVDGALFRVNLLTGVQTRICDSLQGQHGYAVIVVPEPSSCVLIGCAVAIYRLRSRSTRIRMPVQ